ncbi:MAG: methylmalonyl-CoA mutase [Dehalococcoidia bacterium]|jgi:methylmalonyl-CoA mutase, N-terminal domain|nr:methylmalonyl-CoA mutase [Dehalococcoidia bacterium]
MTSPTSDPAGGDTAPRTPVDQRSFETVSGRPMQPLYAPSDLAARGITHEQDIGQPGTYPFTRGIHPNGYRSRPWTVRMFSGFGSVEETNHRFRELLDHGETGLSIAFDMPSLMGYDHDDELAAGEFGHCGVAVDSLADMELLLDGIPLDEITTSMTINGPALVIWAMYIVVAERRGIDIATLGGTLQNDILKEYISQNEFIFPPRDSMRLVTDSIEFATTAMPRWNTISVSGYHMREAGSTAAQELAFTLANGMEYVRWAVERGLDIDDFAPRISFFFNAHNDLLEEVSKFRAARRIWARELREQFGARNPRSWWLRFHTQTSGVALTAEQPEVNLIRVAIQSLAGALGGTQSMHTNAMDEAIALPSEKAVRLAVRTQQVLAHESGVTNTVDPLGGSYLVESLTSDLEREAYAYFERIEELGGVVPALEGGFQQHEIAEAAYRYQREVESGQQIIVGVNKFRYQEPLEIPLLEMEPEGEERHLERLRQLRINRDQVAADAALQRLAEACSGDTNTMPFILEAVRAECTVGEISNLMREVFGEYAWPVLT